MRIYLEDITSKLEAFRVQQKHDLYLYNVLVTGIVRIAQKERITKNYILSDRLRELLTLVGIEVIQGTGEYEYKDIPKHLIGNPVVDTWRRVT